MAVHRFTQDLDLPLAGGPAPVVEEAPAPQRVALVAADSLGLEPAVLVQVGERVLRGTPRFEDKAAPGVRRCARTSSTSCNALAASAG